MPNSTSCHSKRVSEYTRYLFLELKVFPDSSEMLKEYSIMVPGGTYLGPVFVFQKRLPRASKPSSKSKYSYTPDTCWPILKLTAISTIRLLDIASTEKRIPSGNSLSAEADLILMSESDARLTLLEKFQQNIANPRNTK